MVSARRVRSRGKRPRRCVAVIGDVVRSRRLHGAARYRFQEQLGGLLKTWNKTHRPAVLARFVITLGDEFQGLLCTPAVVPALIRDLETALDGVDVRWGIGRGDLETELQGEALGMDGSVWHAARAGVSQARDEDRLGGVFVGFDDWTGAINAISRMIWTAYADMTPQQRRIVDLFKATGQQTQVATTLGILQPTVSRALKAVRWPAIEEAERALADILNGFDDTALWSPP